MDSNVGRERLMPKKEILGLIEIGDMVENVGEKIIGKILN